ncbi:hypothetical protein A2U01_0038821 [Trifolium medium]|uniref:Uncharacterized protein n=1 Tax=Trifolium medium TaxID=97028 RepID=A0A392Q001_9FABA|nr:hypothetical protein [Trifolium medium]
MESKLEQVREVKVEEKEEEKARKPISGRAGWLERLRDVSWLKEKVEIWMRRLLRSPWKWERSREVRLANLWKRRGRKGRVGWQILRHNL